MVTERGVLQSVAERSRGGGGGGGSEHLPLAPDDRVVEQVERVGDELARQLLRLTGVERPRLTLAEHLDCQRYSANNSCCTLRPHRRPLF